MGSPNQSGLFFASLADFSAGMNSDVPPIALQSNQLSFATNATLRGNYFTHRPPNRSISLSFGDGVQENFEENLWQGAAYYKPDSGSECIIASVGGRLFKITPSAFGATANVDDISAAGSLNNPSTSQAWLWQGENFMFCNDGESAGLIFNGNSTRRLDAGTVVGTLSGAVSIPLLDGTVTATLTANYSGEYGVSVQVFPTASSQNPIGQFQVNPVGSSYRASLTNINAAPGLSIAAGSQVVSNPSFIAKTTSAINVASNSSTCFVTYTWSIDSVYNWNTLAGGGQFCTNPNEFWTALDSTGVARVFGAQTGSATAGYTTCQFIPANTSFSITPGTMVGWVFSQNPAFVIPAGTTITKVGSPGATTVAVVSAPFTTPAAGSNIEVELESPYSGANGAAVYINGDKYLITAVQPSASPQVTLTAISLSQTTGQIPSGAILKTLPELPAGRMGVYGLGRNWICLPDGISYVASDIVGGSSGTIANAFRDSILNVTENNFLAGGGVFRVPSAGQQINAMRFPATLDSSLGQGPLQVLTQNTTFSCNAPVQRSAWQDMTNPIQTQSLVGGGALSQNSTVAVNGDLFFRSLDGIRSLRLARQDFQTSYSNTPQSVEMNRVLLEDDRNLLGYSSAIVFDNRLLMTASPTQSQRGVYHSKLIALNLDPNSSLRVKQPPIYDGAWDGLDTLQLIVGTFNGIERAFAFTYDATESKIGLSEILPTATGNLFDDGDQRIKFSFESPALFYQPDTATRQLLRLNDGEIIVKDIVGDVRFDVYYRPDYDSTWRSWHSWEVTDSPSYQPRMGLGQPNLKVGDESTGRPFAVGYHFQVKVVVTGSCTVMGMNFYAVGQPTPQFAKPLKALTPLPT